MNGFVKRGRYPLALLGGSLLGAPAHNYLNTDPATGSSFDGLQFGVQVQN